MNVTPATAASVLTGAADSDQETAGEPRAKVLVVDDDERNLLAIREVLQDLADVITAASGEEALRHLLKDDEFAVILLDVFMPGIDGYETAQIVRGREQTKRIPIVFLSAVNKEAEHLMRGYVMGAVDYVFKPVEPVVLRSKVSVFVDLYEKSKEIERKAAAEQALLDENLRANQELLRAEKELRLAQQRQAAIIESVPIVLYLEPVDRKPRWPSYISGNFDEITGYSYAYIAENPNLWEERLHPEDRPRVLSALSARRESGRYSVEYRWQCADGSYKHFHDQAVLIRDADGAPLHYAGTLLDVTDRKDLETQLLQARKMDAIGKLTGGIAHDFNNLLAAMLGGVGLIERRVQLADDQKKIVAMMRHAAEQGSELVGRLLAFARRQQLQPNRIEMEELARAVTQLLAHTLGGLVRLDWKVADNTWPAYADATQLELALMNLIINARDAMPDGGTISVCAHSRSIGSDNALGLAPGDYVVLGVEDQGSGIPRDIIERVTEPFFTTKEVGKGTGLGLSMVYGFARQSGGALNIVSEEGQGTTVELWLPRDKSERVTPDAEAAGPQDGKASRPLNILLVDDNEAVRATTAALLCDLGHSVATAEDGASMLRMLEGDGADYDLIITDYAMPLMSGGEAMIQARTIKPDMPAIIISGYADAEAIEKKPEGVHVLGKPFSPDEMVRAIARATEAAS
jgi:PAS domain S-box-containing protein